MTDTPKNLTTLTQSLENAVTAPNEDPAILARQAALLDQLFTTIVDQKICATLDEPRRTESTQNWLHFALRVQKQCTDTVKARAAIQYMQDITTPKPVASLPRSPKTEKRTDEV